MENVTSSSHFQVLELQAVNAELQKKLLLMEKDIVGKDPVDSEKEPDLINLSTPIKVLRITVYSQIVLEMPLVYFLCNVF